MNISVYLIFGEENENQLSLVSCKLKVSWYEPTNFPDKSVLCIDQQRLNWLRILLTQVSKSYQILYSYTRNPLP